MSHSVLPHTAAHQAPPSLGFSRQEHWSGLPFPSPMHESEKWKWSRSVVSDSSRPHGLQPTRLLCPWDFPGKSTGCHRLLRKYVYICPKCMLYTLLLFSHAVLSNSFVTPWTIALQAPLSMLFPRQEYWRGLPFPSPGGLPQPQIELCLLYCRRILYCWVTGKLLYTLNIYDFNVKYTLMKLEWKKNVIIKLLVSIALKKIKE